MEHQKHGASSTDDDDDDDDEEGSKEDDEDLTILQSVPNISHGSGSGARPSSADGLAGAGAKESFAQNWAASWPLRGPSPKCPCATADDGPGSSRVAPVFPFPPGFETLIVGATEHRPSMEIPEGEDPDLL
jgi:hypothetical protein